MTTDLDHLNQTLLAAGHAPAWVDSVIKRLQDNSGPTQLPEHNVLADRASRQAVLALVAKRCG